MSVSNALVRRVSSIPALQPQTSGQARWSRNTAYVDLVGHGINQPEQEVARCRCSGVLVELDEGELAGPVDRHEHIELALLGAHLGHVDMEVANGAGVELTSFGLVAFDLRQARDVVALEAAMQRGAGQARNAGLQGIETVIQWQQ
jgi:hypothetical protein